MKAIPLDEALRHVEFDLMLLDSLLVTAQALKSPAVMQVEAVLLQQIGCCTVMKRRWESKALELTQDEPARAADEAALAGAREQEPA